MEHSKLNKFEFESSYFIPFGDKDVLDNVRNINQHPRTCFDYGPVESRLQAAGMGY
jgi:hypothetical protein